MFSVGFFFGGGQWSLWYLSFPTRDPKHTPALEGKVSITGPPGKTPAGFLWQIPGSGSGSVCLCDWCKGVRHCLVQAIRAHPGGGGARPTPSQSHGVPIEPNMVLTWERWGTRDEKPHNSHDVTVVVVACPGTWNEPSSRAKGWQDWGLKVQAAIRQDPNPGPILTSLCDFSGISPTVHSKSSLSTHCCFIVSFHG